MAPNVALRSTAPVSEPSTNDKHPPSHHNPNPVFENSLTFQMACRQLETVAEAIDLDQGILERLSKPKRAMVVSIPIRMDSDGRTETFIGFRVQHSLTSGPSKGGLRYHPRVVPGEVDVLEVLHHDLPLGGRKGRACLRPCEADSWRGGARDPPLHRGGIE